MGAQAGHGALIYCNLTTAGAVDAAITTLAQFRVVGGLFSDLTRNYADRATTEITPHNNLVGEHVVSPVIDWENWSFTVNLDQTASAMHTALKAAYRNKVKFGMALVGAGSTIGSGIDETLVSGELLSVKETNPRQGGQRALAISFRPTGSFYDNGVLIGT